MRPQADLDSLAIEPQGQIFVVKAVPGEARKEALRKLAARADSEKCRVWVLPCSVPEEGIWAGLKTWLLDLIPVWEAAANDLIDRHDFELASVLPELRTKLKVRRLSLTDTSAPDETVRNYAIDRAYRIGQGLVDLLDEWHSRTDGAPWVVICDDFDQVGALVRRFFSELVRRRAGKLGLNLILATAPENADEVLAQFAPGMTVRVLSLDLAPDVRPRPSPAEMAERATMLEEAAGLDPLKIEIHLPKLIRCWSESDQPRRALRWQAMALGLYNHYGFYEDALRYSEPVQANLDLIAEKDGLFTRWNLVGSLFGCFAAVGQPERGYQVVKEEALDKIDDPGDLARICYVMAMLHARFLPEKDFGKAEEYLDRGLQHLEQAHRMPDRDRHFLRVFLLNGLAFVRHRQGRPFEAIELCKSGSEHLDRHLSPDQHRLHRSVLLYNAAQVYSALHLHEQAIENFSAAMSMDPNYSEYYNERGNVYLNMGRYEEAIRDYLAAIELSAPYQEVWTNLGQCYRLMGRLEEAVRAYSQALDLAPEALLARVGRAQALDALGHSRIALQDYDAALVLDPRQPLVLANRAAIRYDLGDRDGSFEDLDAAIALAPETADFYQNRAVVSASLGRQPEAARDLENYLRLRPDAEDRIEVAAKLVELRRSTSTSTPSTTWMAPAAADRGPAF